MKMRILLWCNPRRKQRSLLPSSPQEAQRPPNGGLSVSVVEMTGIEPVSELSCYCASTVCSYFFDLKRCVLRSDRTTRTRVPTKLDQLPERTS